MWIIAEIQADLMMSFALNKSHALARREFGTSTSTHIKAFFAVFGTILSKRAHTLGKKKSISHH